MLDLMFAMIAAAASSAGSGGASGSPENPSAAEVAPPAFLSPTPQLVAEPQVPTGKFTTATEVKPILNATRGNWIAIREYDGQDLLYVTHLWAWRCGLVQLQVGLNGAAPEIWPLPACHEDQAAPNQILEQDGLPFRGFALNSLQSVDVILTYDDLSEDMAQFERAAVLTP